VELDSERRYRFAVAPDALWSAIADTSAYRGWWPWLTSFDAAGLVAGEEWRCAVRPPLPYTLRFSIHLDEVVPTTLVTAHLTGDITGPARLDLEEDDGGCAVRLSSRLQPSNPAFGFIAAIARPLVRRGHDWVLDTGAGQFGARAVDGR
jgi:uncharacterized protein YndB with AHSA1/START domain